MATQPATKKSKSTPSKPSYTILKKSTCPTLSRSETISFKISTDSTGDIYIRLTGNSGNGHYSKASVRLTDILDTLASWAEKYPITESPPIL